MTTYVYSTLGTAKVTHIGNAEGTLCGFVIVTAFAIRHTPLPGRPVCVRCAARKERADRVAHERDAHNAALAARRQEAADRRHAALARQRAERDAALVALLTEGVDNNRAIARRLGIGLKTTSTRINDAMRRAGARTRFQWGLAVGRAEATR